MEAVHQNVYDCGTLDQRKPQGYIYAFTTGRHQDVTLWLGKNHDIYTLTTNINAFGAEAVQSINIPFDSVY